MICAAPVWALQGQLHPRGYDDLRAALATADVVILGEVHDNPTHHENQSDVVRDIRPSALVFEMFGPDMAAQAASVDRSDTQAMAHALQWEASGWPPFEDYAPIFAAAPQARLYGGATARSEVRRAFEIGAAAVLGLPELAPSLPAEEQDLREAEQFDAHCGALPTDMLPGMVEAQRLRDAVLAQSVAQALRETGGPVAVITGNGHARHDRGISVYLDRLAAEASVVTLGQLEHAPDTLPPFDFFVLTKGVDRDDPCAAFK